MMAVMRSDGPYGHLYEQITEFASLYFGDNIEWDKLEEFNMVIFWSLTQVTDELTKVKTSLLYLELLKN